MNQSSSESFSKLFGELFGNLSDALPSELTQEASGQSLGELSRESSDESSDESSNEFAKELSGESSGELSRESSGASSGELPDDWSGEGASVLSPVAPDYAPDSAPNYTPDSAPNYAPDSAPGCAPGCAQNCAQDDVQRDVQDFAPSPPAAAPASSVSALGDEAFDPSEFLVLVVDDVLTNLQVVGSILDGAGYETAFATSGQAALQQITVTLPDLILLDLMMPGLDGLDTCTHLRSNPAYASIPIIFLTASNEKSHLLSAFQRGAADYVTKPFNPLELLARVRIHLELKHTRDRLATTLTTLQQAFQDLQELATTDPLTGLGNRRRFFDLAEMTLRRAERYGGVFGIILLDLDHFKTVNDTYGHATGDEVLKALGRLIPNLMRQSDCCCRFGGEEFVILLPETGLHESLMVAERLRQAVEHLQIPVVGQATSPATKPAAMVRPTMSAGVAIYRRTDMEVDDVVNRADTALYAAKAHGRNRVTSAIAPPPL